MADTTAGQTFSDPIGMTAMAEVERTAQVGGAAGPRKKSVLDMVSPFDIFMFAFGFIVIGAACTFTALYFYQHGDNASLQSMLTETSTCPDVAGCIHTATRVLANKDESYDPCANFYNYACNGFRRQHYSPDVITGHTSTADLLNEQRVNELSRIMRGEHTADFNANLFVQRPELSAVYAKITGYYRTCSTTIGPNVLAYIAATDSTTAQSQAVLLNVMNQIEDYIRTNVIALSATAPDTLQRLYTSMYTVSPNLLAQIRGLDTVGAGIFPTGVFDVVTFAKYTPGITPVLGLVPALLPSATNFASSSAVQRYRAAITKILYYYVYDTTAQADSVAALIVAFEARLASIAASRPLAYSSTWPQYSVAQLQSTYPNIMGAANPSGWSAFFRSLDVPQDVLNAAGTTASDTFAVHVSSPAYFAALDTLIGNSTVATVQAYAVYMELLQLAAIAQMHGVSIPSITYGALPVGFDPYASTAQQSLMGGNTAAMSRLALRFDQVAARAARNRQQQRQEQWAAYTPQLDAEDVGDPANHLAATLLVKRGGNLMAPLMDVKQSSLVAMARNIHDSALAMEQSGSALVSTPKETAILESITNNICVQDVMEKFPGAMASLYASIVLPESRRGNVKKVAENVRAALRARLADPTKETWLDDQSRARAVQKVDAMDFIVGFPESFLQPGFLDKFYAGMMNTTLSRSSFFYNALQTIQNINFVQFRIWSTDFAESSLELFQDWTQVNAYNALAFNKVVLPMGFLSSLVYQETDPQAMIYGTVGYIVGHEMAHAFSPTGLQYDQYGAPNLIFSADATASYNAQKNCFAKVFSNNVYLNVYGNGNLTFPDNMADHVGLKASWDAYVAQKEAADFSLVRLPGLVNFTDSQLYYLGFSQLYCTVADTSLLKAQQNTSTHTIPFFRVTSTLSLLPGFSTAWSCDASAAMAAQAGSCTLFKRDLGNTFGAA